MSEEPPPLKKNVATRLPTDEYADLEDYCDEHQVSQADALRRFIRQGLEESYDDTKEADAEREQEDRLQILARVGEKFAAVGTVLALVSMLLPILASLTASFFELTVSQFYLVVGFAIFLATVATVLVLMSILGLIAILTLHGIEVGFFGHKLAKVVPTPEREGVA